LKLLTTVSQTQVMKLYLDGEVLKRNKPIPPTFSALNLDDPNATDQWLRENGFKPGVITGFAQWAIVELSVDDIGNIAVVNHIFQSSRVLKTLAGAFRGRHFGAFRGQIAQPPFRNAVNPQ
jgi:hypothetical protein